MKYIKCLTLVVTIMFGAFAQSALAKSTKGKSSVSRSAKNKGKFKKTSRYKRAKKSGNGPDLKALTTTSPYVESPANGVNSVETQPGI